MAVDVSSPEQLRGATVNSTSGDKLGKVDEIYLDNETGKPEWAAVKTGFFGSNVSLVPLAPAEFDGDNLVVPFTKDKLQGAPNHDPGYEISESDERELFTYYGVPYGGDTVTATSNTTDAADAGTGYTETTDTTVGTGRGVVGNDTSGPETDDAMTRSEERVRIGTQTRESGRARLRKFIVTETETRTVPVSHEEVVLEREPITDANRGAAMSGGDLTEEEHEVTLRSEVPVVEKETVPVERVRMDKRTVTGEQSVTEEVRKEQIETVGVDDADLRDRR